MNYNKQCDSYSLFVPFYDNPYMKAFLKNISLRPSCYACKANVGRSSSDLMLADFWGVDKFFLEMDYDKGTGLLLFIPRKEKIYSIILI